MVYPRYIITKQGLIGHRSFPSENHYSIGREQREADQWELSHGGKNLPEVTQCFYEAVDQYAIDLLKEHHCSYACYRDTPVDTIKQDLETIKDKLLFPLDLVAWAIHRSENSIPFPDPAPYHMVWDGDSCCDGTEHQDFEDAKAAALDCLCEWQAQFKGTREDWDYMIYNCSARVTAFDPESEEYEDCWYPSDEDLRKICWVESVLLPDEMQKILWPDKQAGKTKGETK